MIRYTELKSTNRQNLSEVLPLSKPFTVLLEPSSLCNFKCIHCFQSVKCDSYFTRNRGNMPMTRFQRVLEQLKAWPGPRIKVLKLSLYGEPLVTQDFCNMLAMAKAADIADRMETTTNASLLSRDIAQKLVECQLDYVRVSVYATDQERHVAVTGSAIAIGIIHENLRILQEVKKTHGSVKPFVNCKMLDSYGHENDQFMHMFQDVSDETYIDKPHGWIRVEGADFIEKYYKNEANNAKLDVRNHSTHRLACPMAFTTMAVRSNGDVSPCCVDFIGGTNLGNADQGTLEEIWNSESWYEFQKMQLENRNVGNPSCANCDFYLNDHYIKDNVDGFDVKRLLGAGSRKAQERT